MNTRKLGQSGLKLSEISLGSWVTFGRQVDVDAAANLMSIAYDHGINFFDNAEVYAAGVSEEVMGAALKKLGLRRGSYTISTKFYWGLNDGPLEKNTLNRKRLLEAMDGSLRRLGLDAIDLIFCHRDDLDTPIEEIVLTMHEIVASGRAYYWGTSEWTPDRIGEAHAFATRHGLHAPRMEQPQYNLVYRNVFEQELTPKLNECGMGTTTWSPLASGLLSGKYNDGIPAGSRLDKEEWLRGVLSEKNLKLAKGLAALAGELDCTPSQLAIAWILKNPNVTTVITGASRPEQLLENLKASEVAAKLDDGLMQRLNAVGKD